RQIFRRVHRGVVVEELSAVRLADLLEHPVDYPAARLRVSVENEVVRHRPTPTHDPQYMCWPPFTDNVEPVMKSASSATRNNTVRAMPSALTRPPTGMRATIFSSTSFGTARTISVST